MVLFIAFRLTLKTKPELNLGLTLYEFKSVGASNGDEAQS